MSREVGVGHTLADAGLHHIGCRAAQRTGTPCITRSRWPPHCRTLHTQEADVGGGSWSQGNNTRLAQHSWIITHMCMTTHTHTQMPLEVRLGIIAVLTYQQEKGGYCSFRHCKIHNDCLPPCEDSNMGNKCFP